MPQDISPPPWVLPADLAAIVQEDGEWEDPSWDPVLLTVIGDTRHEGRHIKIAWQLSLWPSDVFFKDLSAALGEKPDGPAWSHRIQDAIAAHDPALAGRLHDDSDASTCMLWAEREADGRALMEMAWVYLHGLKAKHAG